jgi:hypothetical protein
LVVTRIVDIHLRQLKYFIDIVTLPEEAHVRTVLPQVEAITLAEPEPVEKEPEDIFVTTRVADTHVDLHPQKYEYVVYKPLARADIATSLREIYVRTKRSQIEAITQEEPEGTEEAKEDIQAKTGVKDIVVKS